MTNRQKFVALIDKKSKFLGNDVSFIRWWMRKNQSQFAKMLNKSNHSIVSQWEKKGTAKADMFKNTEIILRLQMARAVGKKQLAITIEKLLF